MIECRQKFRLFGQEHSVPEDVTRHVPDADAGERLGLNVATNFSKVPFDRFPCSLRSNSHFFVIVAVTSPRCESVAQPETAPLRDLVRIVGE